MAYLNNLYKRLIQFLIFFSGASAQPYFTDKDTIYLNVGSNYFLDNNYNGPSVYFGISVKKLLDYSITT
ncbi:MAG: hypothetical protein KAR38_11825, partial [Calditrichia bacterium]|nr:hypothetical protein [Calditrichia bacterium]